MKMLMIVCPKARQEDVTHLIESHGIYAYSEIPEIIGEGKTGKKFGTHAFPEKSSLIFTVIEESKEAELVIALKHCSTNLYPGEGMKAFVLPVESII